MIHTSSTTHSKTFLWMTQKHLAASASYQTPDKSPPESYGDMDMAGTFCKTCQTKPNRCLAQCLYSVLSSFQFANVKVSFI